MDPKSKKQMAKNREIVDANEAYLRQDRLIIPPRMTTKSGALRWDRHDAKKLLKKDILAKKHELISPAALFETRKEYQKFDQAVFRKHIYQEAYSQVSSAYWQYKMKKKKEEDEKFRNVLNPF